mmetsp:Transcript_16605/g.45729  ORF Transcript_16605/g.45729 Transcript_16605/m.45729 type:complete len:506 (-) Transcript_16605:447-1964(-)
MGITTGVWVGDTQGSSGEIPGGLVDFSEPESPEAVVESIAARSLARIHWEHHGSQFFFVVNAKGFVIVAPGQNAIDSLVGCNVQDVIKFLREGEVIPQIKGFCAGLLDVVVVAIAVGCCFFFFVVDFVHHRCDLGGGFGLDVGRNYVRRARLFGIPRFLLLFSLKFVFVFGFLFVLVFAVATAVEDPGLCQRGLFGFRPPGRRLGQFLFVLLNGGSQPCPVLGSVLSDLVRTAGFHADRCLVVVISKYRYCLDQGPFFPGRPREALAGNGVDVGIGIGVGIGLVGAPAGEGGEGKRGLLGLFLDSLFVAVVIAVYLRGGPRFDEFAHFLVGSSVKEQGADDHFLFLLGPGSGTESVGVGIIVVAARRWLLGVAGIVGAFAFAFLHGVVLPSRSGPSVDRSPALVVQRNALDSFHVVLVPVPVADQSPIGSRRNAAGLVNVFQVPTAVLEQPHKKLVVLPPGPVGNVGPDLALGFRFFLVAIAVVVAVVFTVYVFVAVTVSIFGRG